MQGKQNIIDGLNELLGYELAAMDQYFIHSEMYADWGLSKLHERIAHEFDDEKGHAKELIARILFLEGKPDMVTRDGLNIGSDVPSMLKSDLDVEYAVAKALKSAIALCETEKDFVTREILEQLKQNEVKLIVLRCAGFNNVDLKAAEELGIEVGFVPCYSPNAIAEHTAALVMVLNRRLHQAYNRIRNGDFRLDGLVGFDMNGKIVGVLGMEIFNDMNACKKFQVDMLLQI